MNVTEFSNEFDLAYNNATNDAPAIDMYEKSVYLTRAQLEIVSNYFHPQGNKYKKGFEQSSKRRNDLRELIRPGISTTPALNFTEDEGVSDVDSQFFRIKDNVYLIIQEKIRISSDDACLDQQYIKVVPKTHDEINIQEKNPFRKPDTSEAWRVDMYTRLTGGSEGQDDNKVVELITPYTINQYKYRYIIYPSPIILVNLLDEYPEENLTIDGVTSAATCALSESIHREIIGRAVELATVDYKPQEAPSKVEINKRNE
ncbi:MAG: hypothetical protein KUG81_10830 [Gammaproteobacteria bacterium]|nr:hypothetical protein [Gammaproteobacteria bacterium]